MEDVAKLDKQYMAKVIAYVDSYSEYLAKNFSQEAILSHDGLSIS